MPQSVQFEEEDDPSNLGVKTLFMRFLFHEGLKNYVKSIGWWWKPDVPMGWYIPTRKIQGRAQRAEKVTQALSKSREFGFEILDPNGVLPLWQARTNPAAAGSPLSRPDNQGQRPRVIEETLAALATFQGTPPDTLQPNTVASHAAAVSARPQTERGRREGRPSPAQHPNLNRLVQQRVAQQRAEQERREMAQQMEGWRQKAGDFRVRWKPEDNTLIVTLNNGTLRLYPGMFEDLLARLECPLKNSFHQELVELWRERNRYLLAHDIKEQTYAQLEAGLISQKEAYIRFPFWRDVDFSKMDGVLAEFEAMSTALGENGLLAIQHAAKGCHKCKRRSSRPA